MLSLHKIPFLEAENSYRHKQELSLKNSHENPPSQIQNLFTDSWLEDNSILLGCLKPLLAQTSQQTKMQGKQVQEINSIKLQKEEKETKKMTDTLNSEIHGTELIILPPPHFNLGVPPVCIRWAVRKDWTQQCMVAASCQIVFICFCLLGARVN